MIRRSTACGSQSKSSFHSPRIPQQRAAAADGVPAVSKFDLTA
jgi:hypothetical protein